MNPKIQLFILTLGLLLIGQNSFTQVSDSLFEQSCKNEDLIILKENMEVDIAGQKIALMMVKVSKQQTIIINTTEGLSEFQPLVLPKKFDELYIYHASSVRNIDWAYDDIKIQHFDAKLINDEKLNINHIAVAKRTLSLEGFFGDVYEYEYNIEDINVGDTIEISYSYDIPFNLNWIYLLSNRLFFHSKYPIKDYNLKWCYNKSLEVDSVFVNHDTPEFIIEDNKFCYKWHMQNLPGCLDEPASRPYKSLPYFVFVPKSYDLEYTHFNSFKMEFIPTYFFESWDVQSKLYDEYWDNVIGNKSRDNLAYKTVADRYLSMAPNDSTGITLMRYFQRFMVDTVTYDPAIDYYSYNETHLKQRAGVDLKANTVKDHNIERIYGNMIPKFGLDFFTAYPVDSRVGEISPYYNSTVKDNDLMFGVAMKDKTLCFVIPRSDKNLYYFEEVPFYYEDIPVLLIHYTDFPNQLEKRNFNTNFRTINTPTSRLKDNYRKTQSKVNVSLINKKVDFQTRIMLSGQYSTLTRNVYTTLAVDSTVNPKYFEPVWNIGEDVLVEDSQMEHPQIFYPFKTTITSTYESKTQIETENEVFKINIGSWFKPIYNEGIVDEIRFLDYYPDFVGYDTYSYMLEFDKPVKLIDEITDINIKNDYANLSFSVKQTSENTLLITYNYSILTRMVKKENIDWVKEINQMIFDLKSTKISIQLAE